MKKNKFTIIILLVLVIIAIIVYFSNKPGTLKKELRDFAIQDTSTVDKIFMATKAEKQVLLERKNGEWFVNGKYKARKDAINLLLKTMNRIDVKSPVSKASFNNVVKNLSSISTKVEIYQNGTLSKTYYVGGPTQDQYGTYMMLEGSSTPFIIHIPGFPGYLTTRFFIDESEWRAPTVFSYQYPEIAEIKVENMKSPEKSFIIKNDASDNPDIYTLSDNKLIENKDTLKIKEYIALYRKINFEALVTVIRPTKKDSILKQGPTYKLSVTTVKGATSSITTYLRPGDGLINDDGNPYEWDPDRLYGILDNGEMAIIQYYSFDPLFREWKEFVK